MPSLAKLAGAYEMSVKYWIYHIHGLKLTQVTFPNFLCKFYLI